MNKNETKLVKVLKIDINQHQKIINEIKKKRINNNNKLYDYITKKYKVRTYLKNSNNHK